MTSREQQRAKQREYSRKWRAAHPDRAKESSKRSGIKRRTDPVQREKTLAYAKAYRQQNREKVDLVARRAFVRRKYGISLEQYDSMFTSQGGCCAVCGRPETYKNRSNLAVDHDHMTGEVRSLLDHRCNTVMGMMGDDPDLLEAAAAYLRAHRRSRLRIAS